MGDTGCSTGAGDGAKFGLWSPALPAFPQDREVLVIEGHIQILEVDPERLAEYLRPVLQAIAAAGA